MVFSDVVDLHGNDGNVLKYYHYVLDWIKTNRVCGPKKMAS